MPGGSRYDHGVSYTLNPASIEADMRASLGLRSRL